VSAEAVVRADEPLARRTTLRVGGPAQLWLEPADEDDLVAAVRWAREHHLPVTVLGRGSNLLVRDGGLRGLVIHPGHASFSRIEIEGHRLRCGAGARLKNVAQEARRHGVSGLEFLEGIPGSVGGALRMNAGAHGGSMFDTVVEVRLLDEHGAIRTVPGAQLHVTYRCCRELQTCIALGATLQGRPAEQRHIEQRMEAFNKKRWASQPAAPSAGCIFKNPDTIPAGKLVEELGLKGTRVGGAMVSLEHGNFIVNDGTASAADVLELIRIIQERARSERGIELETEVRIVGEEAPHA